MGMFDFFKKLDPEDYKVQEDMLADEWLEERDLEWIESKLGGSMEYLSEEGGKGGPEGEWPGTKDKLQSVILGSIAPGILPGGGDIAQELEDMPEELRIEARNRIYDLMRNPTFGDIGGLSSIDEDEGYQLTYEFLTEGLNWRKIYNRVKDELGVQNMLHLATGDIMSTEWSRYDPILLYRGQNISEIPRGGVYDETHTNEEALESMAYMYKDYEQSNIKPFTGDLPAMFLGLHDPAEYWTAIINKDDLPKDFKNFDYTKPIYDISNEIGFRRFNVGHLSDQEWKNVDHPEYGDSYFGEIVHSDVDNILSKMHKLKTGKIKAIKSSTLGLDIRSSLDLGTYLKTVGYDHDTDQYYVSATDIWDFNKGSGGGSYNKWGLLSPSIEGVGEGIQMYGRIYLSEQELLDNIVVLTNRSSDATIISRLSTMMENEKLK
tara:strand:- start:46 stop:1344 length:1299 start_codon:yes stop_codon:yes gene_type:complete